MRSIVPGIATFLAALILVGLALLLAVPAPSVPSRLAAVQPVARTTLVRLPTPVVILTATPTPVPTETPTPLPTATATATALPVLPTTLVRLAALRVGQAAELAPAAVSTPINPALASGVVAYVTQAVNGDTIRVAIGGREYTVRYLLIDAPDLFMLMEREATQANEALVFGQKVILIKDEADTAEEGEFLLRYVYLPNGTLVNAELVRLGLAQVTGTAANSVLDALFQEALAEAQGAGVGLWQGMGAAPAAAP